MGTAEACPCPEIFTGGFADGAQGYTCLVGFPAIFFAGSFRAARKNGAQESSGEMFPGSPEYGKIGTVLPDGRTVPLPIGYKHCRRLGKFGYSG